MAHQKHCPGCFANKNSLAVCPYCGYDESAPRHPLYLPHGLTIGEHYRVGRVLGQPGGFGISYLAWDIHLQQRVAIKEYLPRDLARRVEGGVDVVVPEAAQRADYDAGLEHFLREARVIARLDHPNIVRVRNFFRAHGTAYLVMDFYEGVSLGDYLSGLPDGSVEPAAAARLLGPVLLGLSFVHEHGIVHRDIKPHNIYLATGGRAILLDFGSAAALREGQAGAAPTVVLSEGFAPLEQYQRHAEQGAWSDVYGVAATLYRMVMGMAPPPALDRVGQDPLDEVRLPGNRSFQAVLRRGLALRGEDRFRSAQAFRQALFEALGLLEITDAVTREYEAVDAPAAAPVAPEGGTSGGAAAAAATEALATRGDLRRASRLIAAALLVGAAMIAAALWLRPGC
ncbi:MAG TPA: serine/threonine-protein kinase [Solimonas sp.]